MPRMTTTWPDVVIHESRWVGVLDLVAKPPPRTLTPAARSTYLWSYVVGTLMVVASTAIHFYLWNQGQKDAQLGHAFLFQWISGVAIIVALLAYRRLLSVVAGLIWSAGSVAALVIAQTIGILGDHNPLSAPLSTPSLAVECLGVLAFVVAAALMLRRD